MNEKYWTMDELWMDTVNYLFERGDERESRIGKVKESTGFQVKLYDVGKTFLLNPRRKLSPMYGCAEFLWYMSQTKTIDMIKAYAPQYEKYADDGLAHGAYGYRIARNANENQLDLLVQHLREKSNSRQAIITFWQANDLWHSVYAHRKDLPCTLSLQFLIRDNKLHVVTTMRSNDAWLGLPYDVFCFTCLQWLIASILGIKPGSYTHQVGSMHLYEKNWKAAEEALVVKYETDYRRLEHEWSYDMPNLWRYQIDAAVENERAMREKREVTMNRPDNDTLSDTVACCAYKWNYDLRLKSPLLQEALKNVHGQVRKSTDAQKERHER